MPTTIGNTIGIAAGSSMPRIAEAVTMPTARE